MPTYGKRSVNFDGSDHIHREKVANQYVSSVHLKQKLRVLLFVSAFPCIFVIAHIIQIHFNIVIIHQKLPSIEVWEYIYLMTLFLPVIGWMSLKRNRSQLLQFYSYSSILFSVLSLLFALAICIPKLIKFFDKKHADIYLFGQPYPIVLFTALLSSVLLHSYVISIAVKLVQAWKTKGFKQK